MLLHCGTESVTTPPFPRSQSHPTRKAKMKFAPSHPLPPAPIPPPTPRPTPAVTAIRAIARTPSPPAASSRWRRASSPPPSRWWRSAPTPRIVAPASGPHTSTPAPRAPTSCPGSWPIGILVPSPSTAAIPTSGRRASSCWGGAIAARRGAIPTWWRTASAAGVASWWI